ncbi:unnamed protein product, partial [Vitis vinifera]
MKGPLDRTKVMVRHLPPMILEAAFLEQINTVFKGRYTLVKFRPGKNSQQRQSYSRAYLDFKRPEDVIEFAEFFDGHVFVNEKDPEYLEFLELLAKPFENLPKLPRVEDSPPQCMFYGMLQRTQVQKTSGAEALKEESGVSGAVDAGKKKVLLLKGKEREISHHLQQQNVTSPVKNILGANSPKQNQRREGSGRIIRSILLNKDARQSQSSMFQSGQQSQASNLEKEKRPPRPPQLYTQPAMQRKVRDAALQTPKARNFCGQQLKRDE